MSCVGALFVSFTPLILVYVGLKCQVLTLDLTRMSMGAFKVDLRVALASCGFRLRSLLSVHCYLLVQLDDLLTCSSGFLSLDDP